MLFGPQPESAPEESTPENSTPGSEAFASEPEPPEEPEVPQSQPRPRRRWRSWHPLSVEVRLIFWISILLISAGAGVVMGSYLGYLSSQAPIPELEYYQPPQMTQIADRDQNIVTEIGAIVKSSTGDKVLEVKRQVLPLREIPEQLRNAFIALEDARFYQHFGVDPYGIMRALVMVIRRGGEVKQGASTITQQMIRDVLEEKVGREKSYNRKIKEALMAMQAEANYSKGQILEFYLNNTFLGNNAYGVGAAAQLYFGKELKDLTVAECATLASIPQRPSRYNPHVEKDREENLRKLLNRRNTALQYMYEQDMISETSLTLALAEPLPPPAPASAVTAEQSYSSPYFIDYVLNRIKRDSDYRDDVLKKGGYRVITTLNPQYQTILENVLPKTLSAWVDKEPGNIDIIEKGLEQKWQESKAGRLAQEERDLLTKVGDTTPRKGQVRLARIQEVTSTGLTVKLDDYRGFVEFPKEMQDDPQDRTKKVWTGRYLRPYYNPDKILKKNGLIDVKIREVDTRKRQLTLAWYDQRIQGAAVLLDAHTGQILAMVGGTNYFDTENPTKFKFNRATGAPRQPGSSFKPLLYAYALDHNYTPSTVIVDERLEYPAGSGKPYIPVNYERIGTQPVYFGPKTLYWALAHSNNVITVKLFDKLGTKKVSDFYRMFDIVEPEPSWDVKPYLPTCLGALDTTPLSIAAAYLPFTNRGVAIEPLCITRIEDLEGNPLKEIQARERKVMSPESAYIVTAMLREAVKSGTAKATVGKFVEELTATGFSVPDIAGKTGTTNASTNAWFVGYTPDLILTVWVGFDNVRPLGPKMTGSRAAAPIWIEIMRQIFPTRTDWLPAFEPPSGIVYRDFENGAFKQVPFNESVKTAVADEADLSSTDESASGTSETLGEDEAADAQEDREDLGLVPPAPTSSTESVPDAAPAPASPPQGEPLLEPPRI